MAEKLSESLINISTLLMVATERSELIHITGQITELIERSMEIERAQNALPDQYIEKASSAFVKFTEKEVMKMPKQFRKLLRLQGYKVYYRKRTDGRYNCSYELRYARKPYNKRPISASGTTLEEAKANFIKKLNEVIPVEEGAPLIPTDFDGFAMYWFENFHKRKVAEGSYKNNFKLYNRHIKEKFKNLSLKAITPVMVKELLENLPGNGKTESDAHCILNQIFKTAVKHGKIQINPLDLFEHEPHESETGVELTREEEIKLLNAYSGTNYDAVFAVMLYTGLRPNEYKTARIEGKFIVARNSKRRKGKIEYKKIPITPMLRKYLKNLKTFEYHIEKTLRDHFNEILPLHQLKDLRKTFHTRCVECHVDFVAKELYMGHSLGKLQKTYTGNLDEYLREEGKKLNQWYELYPKITPKFDE